MELNIIVLCTYRYIFQIFFYKYLPALPTGRQAAGRFRSSAALCKACNVLSALII